MKLSCLAQKGFFITLIAIVLDQTTKYWALSFFDINNLDPIRLTDFFNLVLVWNKGVSFGFLASAHAWAPYFLILFALILSGFIAAWLTKVKDKWQALSCGLIIGGALGNVIDRIRFGAVVDFLDFHWQNWHYPAFNIADSCICIGAFLLLYDNLFRTKLTDNEKTDSAA